jgi:N-acetylglucosamine kinase-like BadF-type ATPase
MTLYIGVDGGGTSTTFIAFSISNTNTNTNTIDNTTTNTAPTNNTLKYEYHTGCTNYNSVGMETAKKQLIEGIHGIVQKCSATLEDVGAIVCAMSSCNTPKDAILFEDMARSAFESLATDKKRPIIKAFNDSAGALASGTMGSLHGLVVIAGTGMIAYGRNEHTQDGKVMEWVTGGNGGLIDSGSGYMMGLDALRAAFASYDGMGPSTKLLASVLDFIHAKEASEIVPWLYKDHEWGRIAGLARLVLNAADEQDEVAIQIVHKHADYLICAANTILKRLQFNAQKELPVVLNGGLFNHKLLFQLVSEGIANKYPFVQCILPKVEPAEGAALLAMQLGEKQ